MVHLWEQPEQLIHYMSLCMLGTSSRSSRAQVSSDHISSFSPLPVGITHSLLVTEIFYFVEAVCSALGLARRWAQGSSNQKKNYCSEPVASAKYRNSPQHYVVSTALLPSM